MIGFWKILFAMAYLKVQAKINPLLRFTMRGVGVLVDWNMAMFNGLLQERMLRSQTYDKQQRLTTLLFIIGLPSCQAYRHIITY